MLLEVQYLGSVICVKESHNKNTEVLLKPHNITVCAVKNLTVKSQLSTTLELCKLTLTISGSAKISPSAFLIESRTLGTSKSTMKSSSRVLICIKQRKPRYVRYEWCSRSTAISLAALSFVAMTERADGVEI